jgi:cysteinyl-tRNA synthetase
MKMLDIYCSKCGAIECDCANKKAEEYEKKFIDAMNNDFNTGEALNVIDHVTKELNQIKQEKMKRDKDWKEYCKNMTIEKAKLIYEELKDAHNNPIIYKHLTQDHKLVFEMLKKLAEKLKWD